MSSEEVAYREEHPVAHGDEPPIAEDLPAEAHGGGVVNWLIGLAIVLPVLGLYAALAYAAYLVAQSLV